MRTCRTRLTLFAAVAVLAASMLALFVGAGTAAADGPVQVTVRITDAGFEPKSVDVPLGAQVELTFVWDQTAHPDDEHIIVIPGYKLESEKVDRTSKQTVLSFIASKTGPFLFKCDTECDIHDVLQAGTINVVAATTAGGSTSPGTASLQPARLVMDPMTGIVVDGNTVSIAANLQDKDGKPIAKADVSFYASRTFLGRTGEVPIGTAKTDAGGNAYAIYHPTSADGGTISVKFEGSGLYDATEQSLNLAGSDQFVAAAATKVDDDLHGIKTVAPYVFIGVIGGVWLAFAFMLFQVRAIARTNARRNANRPNRTNHQRQITSQQRSNRHAPEANHSRTVRRDRARDRAAGNSGVLKR